MEGNKIIQVSTTFRLQMHFFSLNMLRNTENTQTAPHTGTLSNPKNDSYSLIHPDRLYYRLTQTDR